MVLNHIAAILFFSGPLFYFDVLLVVDPARVAAIPQRLLRVLTKFLRSEDIVASEHTQLPRPVWRALRAAGVALVPLAIVI